VIHLLRALPQQVRSFLAGNALTTSGVADADKHLRF
jgi:hypothetical protein